MFYKIVDIKTVSPTGVLYLLVHFWLGKKDYSDGLEPYLINDFYIAIETTREVLERDADDNLITVSGKKVSDKTKEDPNDLFKTRIEAVDVPLFVEQTIDRFVGRAIEKKYKGNLCTTHELSDEDPKDVKSKVIAMIGKEKDVNI